MNTNEVYYFCTLMDCLHRPQPYHSLKEVDLMEGDNASAVETHTAPPRLFNEKLSKCNLLGEAFGCQEEPDSQPCSLTKSLEDLRNPKDPGAVQAKFNSKVRSFCLGYFNKLFCVTHYNITTGCFISERASRIKTLLCWHLTTTTKKILYSSLLSWSSCFFFFVLLFSIGYCIFLFFIFFCILSLFSIFLKNVSSTFLKVSLLLCQRVLKDLHLS